jgi:hypothetical protein
VTAFGLIVSKFVVTEKSALEYSLNKGRFRSILGAIVGFYEPSLVLSKSFLK